MGKMNSIGNVPSVKDLERVIGNLEPFNVTRTGLPIPTATLWSIPRAADPYYTGASELNKACLSDADRETLADAVYVIFSHSTPLAWKLRDGRWMIPAHQYSDLANRQVVQIMAALFSLDVREENGNLLQP